ncbi:hypothetical protein, partial [Enterobacter kobei]|uniref:hypothetical protein n=1 Tax=Enterobacter kobei TaxID=208224 RepID=UPI0019545CC6
PEDVCHGTFGFDDDDFHADPSHEAAPSLRCQPDTESLRQAAALIAKAERPLVLAGGGVHLSGATEALTAFSRRFGVPVAHT